GWPSGKGRPVLSRAHRSRASSDLPTSGSPSRMTSLPSGMRPCQIQETFSATTWLPGLIDLGVPLCEKQRVGHRSKQMISDGRVGGKVRCEEPLARATRPCGELANQLASGITGAWAARVYGGTATSPLCPAQRGEVGA